MTVREAAEILKAGIVSAGNTERRLTGGLVTDVMSGAMARGFRGMAWLTCRTDLNALAVAVMKDAACLILTDGMKPGEGVAERAERESAAVLTTDLSAFEAAGRLYAAGLRERENGYADA